MPHRQAQYFSISLPQLSPAQKELYQTLPENLLELKAKVDVDEVIGEYVQNETLYYFARYDGGIAHRFPSKLFRERFEGLVTEYERKKSEGSLEPFDPSAHYIHPLSRVRVSFRIKKRRASASISSALSAGSSEMQEDSEYASREANDTSEEETGEDESYGEEGSRRISTRRSKRSKKSKKDLPFSPKRTRSRRIFVVESDEELTSDDNIGPRRSTRRKKSVTVNLNTEIDRDITSVSDEDSHRRNTQSRQGASGRKKTRVTRPKLSRPAYGLIRPSGDLDYDSDEDAVALRAHRNICEKCHRGPAHQLIHTLLKKPRGKGKKRKTPEDEHEESIDEEENLIALGGWVQCLKCPVAVHWRCLSNAQRDEIMKAVRDKNIEQVRTQDTGDQLSLPPESEKFVSLTVHQATEFICGACQKGGICMGCVQPVVNFITPRLTPRGVSPLARGDVMTSNEIHKVIESSPEKADETPIDELLFRCLTCKRIAHYAHLPLPPNMSSHSSVAEIAQAYTQTWLCGDCSSYQDGVDKIIAWRPYPAEITEPPCLPGELPKVKDMLPREYLVKWLDRSYRRLQWVPHMWLVATHYAKLKNFLAGGSKVELLHSVEPSLKGEDKKITSIFDMDGDSRAPSARPGVNTPNLPPEANLNAESKIPPGWKTVDRVLDILLWHPQRPSKHKSSFRNTGQSRGSQDGTMGKIEEAIRREYVLAFDQGEQPSDDLTETISEWELRENRKFALDDIDQVVWAFIKWGDLGYDQATWDSPPRPGDDGYLSFQTGMRRFLASREVIVPKHSKEYSIKFDKRRKNEYRDQYLLEDPSKLNLGQDSALKLMSFQVDGFNWLCNNWWIHQHCILADEMGLGKTVQIVTFLGYIITQFKAFPALVVVPNSTITNWVREFERWAPKLRAVPFYGEAKARDVIKRFELFHENKRPNETGAKYHVLITTYETLLNPKDFTSVFRNMPRWEVLIIDEGQRLKSDSSLLFRKLNELNSIHRIIMTGTPLNNNIRELFNLMNFLDPEDWRDLEALEKEHEELNEDLVKELHNRLRPYFLRRIKSEVLQLPPKNEIIVPISMAPLQKEVYRSILSHNAELLNGLTNLPDSKVKGTVTKGRINNVLMQLRKCLQHPYLYDESIEPLGLTSEEAHNKLIDGSAKLRFLKSLLPKLRERGHRVLLFSQFVIALDVIEDFLAGEGYKYLRLDGNTKGSDRQKGMDEFNKPGSDVFLYLLTTRAGGVGINLFSADTVIIFDPDFNPHQDLQAIARAYRFGQQKTCLVFKLMVKNSAEERIMQVGKKKLVLDHLIVQKMDDEDSAGENVQSILTFGARALFESDEESRDIVYSDHDIQTLVEKIEKEGEKEEEKKEGLSFSFAKVWSAERDTLEEVGDQDQGDSWAQTLQKITLERDKIQGKEVSLSGRGVRRRAAALSKPNYSENFEGSPVKENPTKGLKASADNSAYTGSGAESESDVSDATNSITKDADFELSNRKQKSKQPPQNVNQPLPVYDLNSLEVPLCGLCAKRHGDGPGECAMTERSENLAEFRKMLLLHAEDESWEERRDAIRAIDNTLFIRGHTSLIAGQPLYPIRKNHNTTIPPVNSKVSGANGIARTNHIRKTPNDYPVPMASSISNAVPTRQPKQSNAIPGPSKRPGSPSFSNEEVMKKKKKTSPSISNSYPFCPVCNQSLHLVKDCPLVAQGPQSIAKQIERLEGNPDMVRTVRILQKLFSKQTKQS